MILVNINFSKLYFLWFFKLTQMIVFDSVYLLIILNGFTEIFCLSFPSNY